MAAKDQRTVERHLDDHTLHQITRGEVDRHNHPDLHRHLQEPCETCEAFLSTEGMKNTDDYDLNCKEVERILQAVLEETAPDRARLAQKARAREARQGWSQWLLSWRAALWLTPSLAAAAFLLIQSPSQPKLLHSQQVTPTPTRPQVRVPLPTFKSAQANGAFLRIQVERTEHNKRPARQLRFRHNGSYKVGDAMLFRFKVTLPGYVYLLREDQKGNLERLFPFSAKQHTMMKMGSEFELQQKGQRVAYFLEKSHLGQQTLWLVHASNKQSFPAHRSQLSAAAKKLFARADYLKFYVR